MILNRYERMIARRYVLPGKGEATHDCSSKSSLESEHAPFGNPFCQHSLIPLNHGPVELEAAYYAQRQRPAAG